MKLRDLGGLAVLVAMMTAPDWCAAQELKVALVDMKRIFDAHPDTRAAEERVRKTSQRARDTFREKTDALKATLQRHQETILGVEKASGAEAEKRRAEASALLARAREMEREVAEFQSVQEAALKKSFLEEKNRIMDAIVAAVKEYNREGRYHLILDKSAAAANGLPMVVDDKGLSDVTEEIIGRLK